MSGIAGIYNLDGRPVDSAVLSGMARAMAHRGPDGAGQYADGPVGLCQRMLHTTPESIRETQPLLDETRALCLVFDGRIDNREELRTALEGKGATLRDDTDAELVLRAYDYWGEECPKKLLGDFAFAVWDRRKRNLFCARDPLGMKPFYYHCDGRTFLFASEMQPLFEEPALHRKPNLILIGLFLCGRFDEREETLYQGVYRLLPAHTLTIRQGSLRSAQYWDVNPQHTIRYRTDAEYAEHFLSLFQEAVRCRLRSHGPVAALLSGGLDSSSIVCTAQKLYNDRLAPHTGFETFSNVFDELPCDERSYIEEVRRQWDIKTNFFPYERDPSCVRLNQTARYPDVLFETTLFMLAPLFDMMRHRGVKVVLDGIGGDELLAAGFGHLTDLLRQGHLRELGGQVRCDARNYRISPASLSMKYCLKPSVPRPLKAAIKGLIRPFRRTSFSLVPPEFLKRTGLEQRLRSTPCLTRFGTCSQQEIYNGLYFGWNPIVSAEKSSLYTARFSLETRRPFFDRRLVDFLLAIPGRQRWRGDQPKLVLREAMDGILPEAIRRRKTKAEFSSPIDLELRDRQANEVEKLFDGSALVSLGVIDRDRLLQLFQRYRQRSKEYLTANVELIVSLELWCRSVLRAPSDAKEKVA
jgi:asparagine synthase (glutamine-hydrolysing)